MAFDQGLWCFLTDCSMKSRINMKNTTQEHLKWERTGEQWEIPFSLNGLSWLNWINVIGVGPITKLRMCVIKIVTFKGVHLIW